MIAHPPSDPSESDPSGRRPPPLDAAAREAFSGQISALPAMRHIGARADLSDPNEVRIVIDPLQPHHRGGLGTEAVNGAVIAGLCDAAIGFAGVLATPGQRGGTVQLSIQMMRPIVGNSVVAVGRVVRWGRHLVFAAAEVVDDHGRLCARGEGIFAVAGGSPQNLPL